MTFAGDAQHTPGPVQRRWSHGGATVIVDYGHNPSALRRPGRGGRGQFPHERRLIVFTAAGDRRDADILRQSGDRSATPSTPSSSTSTPDRRGRADGEILALLRQGLATGSRVSEHLETRGEPTAVALALNDLGPATSS